MRKVLIALLLATGIGAPAEAQYAFQQIGTGQNINPSGGAGTIATATGLVGGTFVVTNLDSANTAYCRPGATAAVTDQPIPSNSTFSFNAGGQTSLSCYGSSASVQVVGGSGQPSGWGGGGGGGGGGGVVTQPTASLLNSTVTPAGGAVFQTQSNSANLATAAAQTTANAALAAIQTNTANFNDPCSYSKKSTFNLAATTTGTAVNLITAQGAGINIYICSLVITTSAQTNFSLISSTTTACGGSPAAVIGSTTAASGLLLGPGVSTAGGMVYGTGGATLGETAVANSYVCTLFTTTNTPTVSGTGTYVATTN